MKKTIIKRPFLISSIKFIGPNFSTSFQNKIKDKIKNKNGKINLTKAFLV